MVEVVIGMSVDYVHWQHVTMKPYTMRTCHNENMSQDLYLPSFCTLGEHHYGDQPVLPDHAPEVWESIGHGTLGCNVGTWMVVALRECKGTLNHVQCQEPITRRNAQLQEQHCPLQWTIPKYSHTRCYNIIHEPAVAFCGLNVHFVSACENNYNFHTYFESAHTLALMT